MIASPSRFKYGPSDSIIGKRSFRTWVGSTDETKSTGGNAAEARAELVEALRGSGDRFADAWADRARLAAPGYRDRAAEEVRGDIGALLEAMIHFIEKDDSAELKEFIVKASSKGVTGHSCEDTVAAIFAGVEEGVRMLGSARTKAKQPLRAQMTGQLVNAFSEVMMLYAKAFEEVRAKEFAAEAISGLARAYESLDEESILMRSVEGIKERSSLDVAALIPGDGDDMFFSRCDDAGVEGLLRTACERTAHSGERATFEFALEGKGGGERTAQDRTLSVTGIPIAGRSGMIGSIAVAWGNVASPTAQDLRMIESIAGHVGVACENTRLYQGTSKAVRDLAAGKSELFTMLSGLEAIVYVADMETHEILAANKKAEEIYGPDLVGRRCYEALQVGQDGPCPFCTNDRLMKDGSPTGPHVWKFRNTATGRQYNCIDKAVLWPDGRHVRLEVAFDITEAEEARIETENAKGLLELYNDILLHELGNFAGTALGYLDMTLENEHLGERERTLVESAKGQAEKCNRLIGKVARFSGVLTAKDDSRDTVDLDDIITEALKDLRGLYADREIRISKLYEDGERRVKVGAFAQEALLNLLTNAVKYGRGQEIEIAVEEDAVEGQAAWKVSVIDRGPGVSPELKERLFKRYSRLDDSRGSKGTGLGLSIARTIADRYQGELRHEDRVQGDHTKGSRFSILLPKA